MEEEEVAREQPFFPFSADDAHHVGEIGLPILLALLNGEQPHERGFADGIAGQCEANTRPCGDLAKVKTTEAFAPDFIGDDFQNRLLADGE